MLRQPQRILVVRTDRIGDVVLMTPLLRALRQRFPSAFIAALVRSYTREVLQHNQRLDAILTDDWEDQDRGWRGFFRKVIELRRLHFDTALLLWPTERAAWMLFLAGIPQRIGVGHKLYEVLTFMRSVSRHKYIPLRHEADYCLDLGRRLGVETDDLRPEVFLKDEERAKARALLGRLGVDFSKAVVGVHLGSGRSSPTWAPERFGAVAQHLTQKGIQIVMTGSASECALVARITRAVTGPIFDLSGRLTLRQLMSVISQFDLLLSSSTGPMHLAAALGVPTVALFCPLPACSPVLWGPIGNPQRILLPQDRQPGPDACQGCNNVKTCRLEGISVGEVVEAVMTLLEETDKRDFTRPSMTTRLKQFPPFIEQR